MKGAIYYVARATVIFSHVKISSFRAKAHLVFHWCLYNKFLFKKRVQLGNRDLDSADLSHPNCFRNVHFKLKLLLFCYRLCFARLGLPIHARILDGKAYSTPVPFILAQPQWHWVPCGRFSCPCTWWNKGYKEMGTETRCYQDVSSVMWARCCTFTQICRFRRYFILSKDLLVYVRQDGIWLMVSSVTSKRINYQGRSTYQRYFTIVYVMPQTPRFVVRANWECHDS